MLEKCLWGLQEEYSRSCISACGFEFTFTDERDSITDNDFLYCPKCGCEIDDGSKTELGLSEKEFLDCCEMEFRRIGKTFNDISNREAEIWYEEFKAPMHKNLLELAAKDLAEGW